MLQIEANLAHIQAKNLQNVRKKCFFLAKSSEPGEPGVNGSKVMKMEIITVNSPE